MTKMVRKTRGWGVNFWASENWSGRVHFEGHSPEWRVLSKLSVQPCSCGNELSEELPVTHGVPQGSILGPSLFVIYINNLPNVLNSCYVSLYADDTVIYCYGTSSTELSDKLNNDLLGVAKWLHDHKLTLNLDKTKCMLIGGNRKRESKVDLTVSILDHSISNVRSFKYLGIHNYIFGFHMD